MKPEIVIYTASYCAYCRAAKQLLDDHDLAYRDVDVTSNREERLRLQKETGSRTIPQVFWNGALIGGHDDLVVKLPKLLAQLGKE